MCVFCEKIDKERVLFESENWIAFHDAFPVSIGHTLIVTKKHFETYFDLPTKISDELSFQINKVKDILDKKYKPDGYNIGINCGEAAGQTVMHFHLHVIPRYIGDVENPRGGVRGVIPSKQKY